MNISELKIVPQFDRRVVCFFTGNRPQKLPWGNDELRTDCVQIKRRIKDEVERLADEGYLLFVCGMARGGDTYFAEAVLSVRREKNVYLECALPCPDQDKAWSETDKLRYRSILDESDYITLVSPFFTAACMMKRNRYMADKSSAVITLNYGISGGTDATAVYARKLGLKVVELVRN